MYLLLMNICWDDPDIMASALPPELMIEFFTWVAKNQTYLLDYVVPEYKEELLLEGEPIGQA